jgi:hypothetical protein
MAEADLIARLGADLEAFHHKLDASESNGADTRMG